MSIAASFLIKDLEAACRVLGIEAKSLTYRRQYNLYATQPSAQLALVYTLERKLSNHGLATPASERSVSGRIAGV
ncbi:MAG: hypothetical protein GY935_12255 [Gammaproteobacteria bacterium]|nr:hypothetical protein [Gammaproteobacteria bacterium]